MNTQISYYVEQMHVPAQEIWGIFALVNPEPDAHSSICNKILLSIWPTEKEANKNIEAVKKEFDITLVGMVKTKAEVDHSGKDLGNILKEIFLEIGPGPQITPKLDLDNWEKGWERIAFKFRDVIAGRAD